jgi:hypothetical protein
VDWLVEANVSEKRTVAIVSPDVGDSMLIQNVGFYQPVHMAPEPRRTSSLLWYSLPQQKEHDTQFRARGPEDEEM